MTGKDEVYDLTTVNLRPNGTFRTRLKHLPWFRILVLVLAIQGHWILDAWNPFPPLSFITHWHKGVKVTEKKPWSDWNDNLFPYNGEPMQWDISEDFKYYTRKLEYNVTEGTWLRLDVHPRSGEVVFDMLGDLYCLPSSSHWVTMERQTAIPILRGIPHDADPHFSPGDGSTLIWRSDAELGVDNIWAMPWHGCDAHALHHFPFDKDTTQLSKEQRLIAEGRSRAYRITNETYRYITDPRVHPSGEKIIATKWYTGSRSLGAGEGWVYRLPVSNSSLVERNTIHPGDGERLIGRTLPPSWSGQMYGEQQIGPEQFIWRGDDEVIYSKNIMDESVFTYSKNVHKGIYAIFATNITTGETRTLVDAVPGGASRPELSRDGRTLAFVRRVRDKEGLVVMDLISGTLRNAWYGLTYDLTTISAPMGTYPSFSFTPSDDAIIIWAAGQIYRVPLAIDSVTGERMLGGHPAPLPFVALVQKRVAETLRPQTDILALQNATLQQLHAFHDIAPNHDGSRLLFSAAGITHHQIISDNPSSLLSTPIPVLRQAAAYYSPSWVANTNDSMVIHACWSNTHFTTLELVNLATNRVYELSGLPFGRYTRPTLCQCLGRQRMIAFIRLGGDSMTGTVVATARAGLYIGELSLPDAGDPHRSAIKVDNIRRITEDVDGTSRLRFLNGAKQLLVQKASNSYVIDIGKGPDELGRYRSEEVARGKFSTEVAVSGTYKAFIETYHVYLVNDSNDKERVMELWARPGNATSGLARLSVDGGHDLAWTGNGEKLFWLLGPYLHSIKVADVQAKCGSAINKDAKRFGIACVRGLLSMQKLAVWYQTDIGRLKGDISRLREGDTSDQIDLVVKNATIITMETGNQETDVLKGASLLIKNGLIYSIVTGGVQVPNATKVIDADGGFVVPGFIDVHSHWDASGVSTLPSTNWQLEAFLAYGVTTHHNPSLDNRDGFIQRGFVESGKWIGPRLFHTGNIIYGAGEVPWHQDINNLEEAEEALARIKAEGGPASFSYKNYNIPSRAARQRLLIAARNFSMGCVPEGGMNYDWDLTYIIDGMTTVEHALPIPKLYEDVINLFVSSGTGYTPTHIVNYGGAWGQEYLWSHSDIPSDPKLRRFIPHDVLYYEATESTHRPLSSWQLFNTSTSAAEMSREGLLINIGAHGQPPVGLMYHAEMAFTQAGGLSAYETLKAATRNGALSLGLFSSLGSLSPGKLADFLIYPPEIDLMAPGLPSTEIQYVVLSGRVYDAETLDEVWPVKGRKLESLPLSAD